MPLPEASVVLELPAFWRQLWRTPQDWRNRRLWVLDLELTGLDPRRDTIISAGWVTIEQGEMRLSEASHCIFRNPDRTPLNDENVCIHRITEQQQVTGLDLGAWWLTQLLEHQNDLWVMHHAVLDCAFLKNLCRRMGMSWPNPYVLDTLRFEQKRMPATLPGGYDYLNLNACRARYGLPAYRAHHALSDALATAELCLAQIYSRMGEEVTDKALNRAFT